MYLRTAESVSPMHPDKMCDRISDAILDWYLSHDEFARVAVEVMGGHGKVFICGEVTANAPEIGENVVSSIVRDITGQHLDVFVKIVSQSREIANGVDVGGAGDQGIMVGYACDHNSEMIPHELFLARSLCRYIFSGHKFDGKTQVTVDEFNNIKTVVASFQNVSKLVLQDLIIEWLETECGIIESDGIQIHANPAGDWTQGGFEADTGLTGRKLAVDNYGPAVPIGGGAFSGKDATKVDRSAAYMARKIAVDYLKSFHAKEVTVKLAYAIGVVEPVMAVADVDGKAMTISGYNLTPRGIIAHLNLREPQFEKTACWGHMGNGFVWDK